MRFRKLRIAWSALCAIACVLLIVLWERSFWWVTNIQVPNVSGSNHQVILSRGTIHFNSFFDDEPEQMTASIHNYHRSTKDYNYFSGHPKYLQFSLGAQELGRNYRWIVVPYWFVAVLLAALGGLPWIRWRFSLRTLLIATTLAAVTLGLSVYAMRTY